MTSSSKDGSYLTRVKSVIGYVFELSDQAAQSLSIEDSIFSSSLRADSLLIQELIVSLEGEFGYPMDELLMVRSGFETVGDVARIAELSSPKTS